MNLGCIINGIRGTIDYVIQRAWRTLLKRTSDLFTPEKEMVRCLTLSGVPLDNETNGCIKR